MDNGSRIVKSELYVTSYCPHGLCEYCFGQGDFGPDGQHVDTGTLLLRADMLLEYHQKHPLGVVSMLGGEPLTHPELHVVAQQYGRRLPLALNSAGLPDEGADIDVLIQSMDRWGATYNPHMADRYVALVSRLLSAGKRPETVMHYRDFDSFQSASGHFIDNALPRLPVLDREWKEGFVKYVKSWEPDEYFPFVQHVPYGTMRENSPMTVCYTQIDDRFTRSTPKAFEPPLLNDGFLARCHFSRRADKAISIDERGRVLPCTSPGQRHVAPVIRDLDGMGFLPSNLPEYLGECGKMLEERGTEGYCDMTCSTMDWALDD